ncbi:hypothetical protein NBRC111894_1030 [Sporolactobacillus inulinus]|uniref:Uncharacterized protein n=1 Tax=Sporolactobacillus inulinus TaxID=2078 RepID=A0A4Y1Z8Z6_9BACL|nr:hypothetical protein NBRC111894_1030 [Sporolactobacillus inulinus]
MGAVHAAFNETFAYSLSVAFLSRSFQAIVIFLRCFSYLFVCWLSWMSFFLFEHMVY